MSYERLFLGEFLLPRLLIADFFTNFAVIEKIITKNNSLWEELLSIVKQER